MSIFGMMIVSFQSVIHFIALLYPCHFYFFHPDVRIELNPPSSPAPEGNVAEIRFSLNRTSEINITFTARTIVGTAGEWKALTLCNRTDSPGVLCCHRI